MKRTPKLELADPTGPTFALRVPGQLRYREAAVRTVAAICRLLRRPDGGSASLESVDLDLSSEFDALVVSAFCEIFNNICLHGYSDWAGAIDIELALASDELVIHMRENGPPFDRGEVVEPDLDQLPESGLGFYIAERCLDHLDYQPGPPNVWTLRKRFDRSAAHGQVSDAAGPRRQVGN
jgi:serine/threonine-protein kinase RsbW